MVSNFKSAVESMAGDKKIEITKSMDRSLWEINRELDGGQMKLSEAMVKLWSVFRYNFSSDDYRKIEKEIGYNL